MTFKELLFFFNLLFSSSFGYCLTGIPKLNQCFQMETQCIFSQFLSGVQTVPYGILPNNAHHTSHRLSFYLRFHKRTVVLCITNTKMLLKSVINIYVMNKLQYWTTTHRYPQSSWDHSYYNFVIFLENNKYFSPFLSASITYTSSCNFRKDAQNIQILVRYVYCQSACCVWVELINIVLPSKHNTIYPQIPLE